MPKSKLIEFFRIEGRMDDNSLFLLRAAACFRSALNTRAMLARAFTGDDTVKDGIFFRALYRAEAEAEIKDPAEICAYAGSQYRNRNRHGEDFMTIFHYMENDVKLANVWRFLKSMEESPGLERLFAIFIIWILQNDPDAERHCLRPLRFELRDVDRERIEAIKNLLDDWLMNGEP